MTLQLGLKNVILYMKKILVKEIDRLKSTTHKKKYISEYLIYVMLDDVKLNAYIEIGEKSKKERVNDLLLTHFVTEKNNKISIDGIITEMSLEEVKKF
jgi:phenylpyruvate tautomerase PptA (4-oxalocrotonate tautomerase family)